jgi:hypothetical protein
VQLRPQDFFFVVVLASLVWIAKDVEAISAAEILGFNTAGCCR